MNKKNVIFYFILAIVVIAVGWTFFWWQNKPTPTVPENEVSPPMTNTDNNVDLVTRGNELYSAGKYDEAFDAYNTALQGETGLADAYIGRGNILMQRRHFQEAAVDFSEALNHLQTPELLASRCNAYRMTAQYDLAIIDCEAAMDLDPGSLDASLSLAMLQLEQGNITEARSTINGLLENYPETAEAYLILSQISIHEDNLDEAIEMLSNGIEIAPTQPQLYWERGFLFYVAGQVTNAKEDMQKVLDLGNPETDGELLLNAGSLLNSLEGIP